MNGYLSAEEAAECRRILGLRGPVGEVVADATTNFGPCECEIPYTDFDGTRASVECGEPGTVQIVVSDEEGEYIVISCAKHAEEWAS